ncbi:hypothetical protein D3C75_525970 [compost metagenome]
MSFLINIKTTGDFPEHDEEKYLDLVLEYGEESINVNTSYSMASNELMEKIAEWKNLTTQHQKSEKIPHQTSNPHLSILALADEILFTMEKEKLI